MSCHRITRGVSLALTLSTLGCAGCGSISVENADQASLRRATEEPTASIQAPAGFRVVRVAEGLNYPSAMDWDDQGRLYVLQSHSVPLPLTGVKIVRFESLGGDPAREPIELELKGPGAPTGKVAVGLVFHEGYFYLSHEEKDGSWGVSRFHPESGETEAVLRGLPTRGDHWVNHLVFDRAGTLYFGIGSATNSGVVSSHDPVNGKWLSVRPDARDIPCRDLALTATSFTEDNKLTNEGGDRATTGGFQAYGQSGATKVAGEALCTSAVYKMAPGAGRAEVTAWGFRNPVGLAVADDGAIYVGAQGADVRGSRPVLNDADAVYRLKDGGWYGWPDFGGDLKPYSDPRYAVAAEHSSAGVAGPTPLIDLARSGLEPPDPHLLVYATEPHAAICGMTVVPSQGPFKAWAGQILVSEMGDFRPTTDAITPDARAGFHVEVVDPKTGQASIFVRNATAAGDGSSQPASALDIDDGLERPVDVRVGPDGLIYVLDFGVWVPTEEAGKVFPKTGKVFRVEPVAPVAP
jgi:glucose/arabinose dehydrogenase